MGQSSGVAQSVRVAPPHDCIVPNFGVMEFTEFTMIFWSILEETERTE